MTPERYQQIDRLLDAALERAPEERAAFLAEACAGDEALRREVESLLAAHDQAGSFIEAPPARAATDLLAEHRTKTMVGSTLGRYQILSLLGAGGMGEVYRAKDTRLGRDVAVKILPEHLATNPEALARFEREARAVAALSHPNILAIHDFGTEHGVSYAVMELLEGETLRGCLSHPLPAWRRAVEIGAAVAEGLAAAHAKGIIHRDLKPENIFLTTEGQIKILDFGLARIKPVVSAQARTLTITAVDATKPGRVMGTFGYMSPEQVRGETADAPSDLFSLGCVLYEIVGGQRPFVADTGAETMAAILRDETPALAGAGKEVPEAVEHVIRHCLEKKPEERYQSARDLAFDLRSLLTGAGTSQSVSALARPRSRPALWIGLALTVLLLGLALTSYFLLWRGKAIESLAVLPFANESAEPDTEYLSDGIAESLINSLSRLPRLTVMSRDAAFHYKGRAVSAQEVGRDLKVQAVLKGRVLKRGDNLSISAELIDVRNNSHFWGEQYNQKLADVLAVQEEIAKQISEKLRLALTGEEQQRLAKRPTENMEAYQLYLKGRFYASKYTAEGFTKGIEFLNQAIALDPTYALAYAGLAATYYDASGTYLNPNDAMPNVKAAAERALALDETLAEAHTSLGQFEAQYKWNWKEAEKEYKRALELNPNSSSTHLYYGYYLGEQGRLDDAIAQITRARELDPLTPYTSSTLAFYYYLARRPDEALAQLQKLIDMDPNFAVGHYTLGLAYEQKGMYEQALAAFNQARLLDPENPYPLALLGHLYAVSGKRGEAQKIIDELKARSKQRHVDPMFMARIYAGLGEKDLAFEWLEKAYQVRSEEILILKVTPHFDNLHSDPRFAALLRRVGLEP